MYPHVCPLLYTLFGGNLLLQSNMNQTETAAAGMCGCAETLWHRRHGVWPGPPAADTVCSGGWRLATHCGCCPGRWQQRAQVLADALVIRPVAELVLLAAVAATCRRAGRNTCMGGLMDKLMRPRPRTLCRPIAPWKGEFQTLAAGHTSCSSRSHYMQCSRQQAGRVGQAHSPIKEPADRTTAPRG